MCRNSIRKGENGETGGTEGTTGKDANIRSSTANESRVGMEQADRIKIKEENEIE